MLSADYQRRIDAVKQQAHGRWTEILAAQGVAPDILKRRNLPCPLCGGTDRFQYTDKFGEGNYHCRKCGSGGGFKLLQALTGEDFHPLLVAVERYLGVTPVTPNRTAPTSTDGMKQLARQLWQQARPVTLEDDVDRYLHGREVGLPVYPCVLRCHPALTYYERDAQGKSQPTGEYPALLACVQGVDGKGVTLHRTYLKDGGKAPVESPRKLLSAGINGGAVRLFMPTEELAVAEGIETALAVHLATGKPVWAALSAGNLEKLWVPTTVQRVGIYADNDSDSDFTGQACAYALARRLRRNTDHEPMRSVKVMVPKDPGADWEQVWRWQRHRADAPV